MFYDVTITTFDFSKLTYKHKTLEQIYYIIDLYNYKNYGIKSVTIKKDVY